MVFIIIFFFISYFILLILFLIGWQNVLNRKPGRSTQVQHFISVIIPFRNEEKVISFLLSDLCKQDYSAFEVILVDDHSDDGGYEVVRRLVADNDRFKLLKNIGSGKKMAITEAVRKAQGTLIITTDADCRVSTGWLSAVNLPFQDDTIQMAFGPVKIQSDHTFFSKLQTVEFASLIGSGIATFGLGVPTICNGANLAFKKSAFEEVGGYHDNLDIPSGDDEFLMRKVVARYPGGLFFLNHTNSIVETKASPDLSGFFHQRLRWAGKWRFNNSLPTMLLAIFIFLFHTSFICGLVFFVMGKELAFFGELWLIKIVLEFLFLYRVCFFLRAQWNIWAFLMLQLVYPFYVFVIGIWSNLFSYRWKGRRSFAKSSSWVGNNN